MGCDICGRLPHAQRLPFLCAVDARNALYEPRIAHACALIQNETLEGQVNTILGTENEGYTRLEALATARHEALQRTSDAAARARKLRRELEAARKEVARRREQLGQRRSDLAAAGNGTAARRQRVLADVERGMAMTRYKWNQSYEAMVATRGFLCLEMARLYGLRRVGGSGGGGGGSDTTRYELGGFEIVDPYNMNNLPPEVVSTSLAHVTHVLVLACHYLAIRLPAEITLPHRDYPRPTIFSLSSSYAHGEVPFPGTALLHPAATTTTTTTTASTGQPHDMFQHVPRARPLYIDKPLGTLARDDGPAYTSFLEGVSLLAYNIAWACCSQGVSIAGGSSGEGSRASLDDVFCMGRNLYNLLIGSRAGGGRLFSPAAANANTNTNTNTNNNTNSNMNTPTPLAMGRYAHGTTHTFLGDSIVQGFIKLPGANRLGDRLKAKLSSESTMPDWEVLEDDAWAVEDDDQQHMEDGVLTRVVGAGVVGTARSGRPMSTPTNGAVIVGSRVPEKRLYGVESVATVMEESVTAAGMTTTAMTTAGRTPDRGGTSKERPSKGSGSGTSGWTKLRSR